MRHHKKDIRRVVESTPLMALLGLGLCLLLVPNFGFTDNFRIFLDLLPKYLLGTLSVLAAALGAVGIHRGVPGLERIAYGFCVLFFCTLVFGFVPDGAYALLLLIAVTGILVASSPLPPWGTGILILLLGTLMLIRYISAPIPQDGSWTGASTYTALTVNSWVRMRGTIKR